MLDNQTFLTIAEAADLLHVSQTSLRRWTNGGKLRAYRIGGRKERRFRADDLLAFIDSNPAKAEPAPDPPVNDYRERHICLFFRQQEEQWQMIYPYLLDHLAAGEPVLYCYDSTPPEQLQRQLCAIDLDVAKLISQDLLCLLPANQVYLLSGCFETKRMLAYIESIILARVAAGYKRLLITGEMTWSLGQAPGVEQLMEYEKLLNPLVAKYPQTTVVCQYDLKRFNAGTVLDVLLTHPTAHLPNGVVPGFYDS